MSELNQYFPYDTVRKQQQEILDFIEENSDKRVLLINAPTGVGKSGVAMALARSCPKAWILTETKALQDQYQEEFSDLVSIKGKNSYKCKIKVSETVDNGPCVAHAPTLEYCKALSKCDYYNVRDKAMWSPNVVTNYNFVLSLAEIGAKSLVHRDVVICDEGHCIEDKIVEQSSFKIDPKLFIHRYDINISKDFQLKEDDDVYLIVDKIASRILDKIDEITKKLHAIKPVLNDEGISVEVTMEEKILRQRQKALNNHLDRIQLFAETPKSCWITDINEKENILTVTPYHADRFFWKYFDLIADQIVIMSASLGDPDSMITELGLDHADTAYIDVDTPFAPEKSPILLMPEFKMGYKDFDSTKHAMVKRIDEILSNMHENEKGIIHSGNYKTAKYITENSIHKDRFLFKESGDRHITNAHIFELHRTDPRPTVLVSPSMHTGVDAKGDLAKFQIIPKLPFANMTDPRVKAKMRRDNFWYANQTWNKIIQACGRATRNEDDESVTYILDAAVNYQYQMFHTHLPVWFKKRIHRL